MPSRRASPTLAPVANPGVGIEKAFARIGVWVQEDFAHSERFPVLAQAAPGEVATALPAAALEGPASFAQIFEAFERVALPGITHWNHPRLFAYFVTSVDSSAEPSAILAETLAATCLGCAST